MMPRSRSPRRVWLAALVVSMSAGSTSWAAPEVSTAAFAGGAMVIGDARLKDDRGFQGGLLFAASTSGASSGSAAASFVVGYLRENGLAIYEPFSGPLLPGSSLEPGQPGLLRFDVPHVGIAELEIAAPGPSRPALLVSYFVTTTYPDRRYHYQLHAEIAAFSNVASVGRAGPYQIDFPPLDPPYRASAGSGAASFIGP